MTTKTFPKKKTAVKTGVLNTATTTASPVVEESKTIVQNTPRPNFSFGKRKEGPTIYELVKSSIDRKTKKKKYALVYMIKAEDVIYDPIKGINRKIRYIPGESSIFEDEQKKDTKVKAPITFNEGFLIVGKQNPTLKKFMEHHNQNGDNPNRMTNTSIAFRKKDTERKAKVDLKKSVMEVDAISLALKMPINKLIGYAKVLGVNVDKSTDEIRYDMKILAQKDPKAFISGMDNPLTEIKENILLAKEHGLISIEANKVTWIKGAARPLITHVPIGKKAVDHFADFCKVGEGESVLDEIKNQLKKFNSN